MSGKIPGARPDIHASTRDLLVTSDLLQQAKTGDAAALDALMARYLPRLQRWACGRLPAYARSLFDTCDLVQETLLKTLQSLDRIEGRGPESFQAYVRQAIRRRILDQIRCSSRRAGSEPVSDDLLDRGLSPLEEIVGVELFERYEKACAELREEEQLFLHLRIELELSYEEIAEAMNRPSPEAARMGVQRALRKLAEIMGHER
jgi:RNA polymerase sigma-70 factor (ECF subfamily)